MLCYNGERMIQRIFLLLVINFVFITTNNATKVHIPIVYACDDKYVMPTIVSMESAMRSKKDTSFYEFTILVPGEFKCEEKFNIFRNKYKGKCIVNIVDMQDAYSGCYVSHWWTISMYYRLDIPWILKGKDKVIYLDGDTLVCSDLQEMWNIGLDNNLCGGVPDPGEYDRYKYLTRFNPNCVIYINSGVLLINCKAWRKVSGIRDMIKVYCQNIEKNDFKYLDQDVLNVICGGRIMKLPFKFMRFTGIENENKSCEYASKFYTNDEFLKGRDNPVIVHYLGREKPWRIKEGVPKKFYDKWRKLFNTINVSYKFKELEFKSRCCCNRCCSRA